VVGRRSPFLLGWPFFRGRTVSNFGEGKVPCFFHPKLHTTASLALIPLRFRDSKDKEKVRVRDGSNTFFSSA